MAGYWSLFGVLLVVFVASAYKQDKCEQRLDSGPCKAHMLRWGYDVDLEQCAEFVYGGCQGNPNNFFTEEECIDSCEHPRSCYNEDDNSWYYDQESKDGGNGCGGCTCYDGLFHCSSCNSAPLVCERLRCDVPCNYGYKSDEDGCDTCSCKPQPGHISELFRFYCEEVCKVCPTDLKFKCPDECDCYSK